MMMQHLKSVEHNSSFITVRPELIMVIELSEVQFWSEIIRVISESRV